ncbi:acetylornithine deacetylase [Roseovarius azorensis]|uniref:Acetylornithine deacetylase n=1 Tax=Roseovarius azorensis TaxID=1287727 RepID=A0A1H7X1N4_9RHOB|nr:acetylornithine deacetylase [Roseovarius azorensis]SEM27750.1 acetylornithine deacetylase [Roseovarius azorensis]
MNGTLEILDRLVAFDTVSARSNLALIAYAEDFLKARGFAVTRVIDPDGEKAGLFAALGPVGAGIMLSAHTDVVPVEGQTWSRDPFRLTREGERLYGRGTTDMKGFLASMLTAADRAACLPLKEPLKLAISYDEEVGCVGMSRMIDMLHPAIGLPRACIVGEPTQMRVAIGHKGKVALRAVCHGVSGHSALAPRFVNALYLATDFVQSLRALQDWLRDNGARDPGYDVPYSTVHVGTLRGGSALNIVPDRAVINFELRHLASDAPEDILRKVETIAARIAREHGSESQLLIERLTAYPGLDTAADASLVKMVQALTCMDEITKATFGTEAGFFDALGIPTVVCGPGWMEGQGHKADEYITTDQLSACDAMLMRLLDRLS